MKNTITLLFLLLAKVVMSQSVDLDKNYLKVSYVKLPQKPILDQKNRTYSFVLDAAQSLTYSKSSNYFEGNVTIAGLEKLVSGGYLSILVNLQDPIISSEDIKTNESKTKDSNGVEKTTYSYTAVIKYKENGNFTVSCAADPSLDKTYGLRNSLTKESEVLGSYDAARSFIKAFPATMKSEFINSAISRMNSILNEEFGYVITKNTDHLWMLGSKKHPEFANNNDAFAAVKSVFDKMEYNKGIASFETELEKPIKYFESVDKTYAEDEKRHRKLRYGAYYNLAAIYYYLDMPDKSDVWCDKLIANNYDVSDGKNMKERNESLRASFALNKTATRHMDVISKTAVVAAVQPAPPVKDLKTDPDFSLVHLVLKAKDTVSGYIRIADIPTLNQKINISAPDAKGVHNYLFRTYPASSVLKVIFSPDNVYASVPFKESTEVNIGPATSKFVKEILKGKTVTLYQYGVTGEIIIKKNKETQGYSANSVGWMMNSKKKFTELAETCPKLIERINNKEFKNNVNSLMAFVEELDMCN